MFSRLLAGGVIRSLCMQSMRKAGAQAKALWSKKKEFELSENFRRYNSSRPGKTDM